MQVLMRILGILTAASFLYSIFVCAFLFCGLCGKKDKNRLRLIWVTIEILRILVSIVQDAIR